MIVIRLSDAPAEAQYWEVLFGPGSVWSTGKIPLNEIALLPEEALEKDYFGSDQDYSNGEFDWFFIFFYDAEGKTIAELYWQNIHLPDGYVYLYSYDTNLLTATGEEVSRMQLLSTLYSMVGMAGVGMLVHTAWGGIL